MGMILPPHGIDGDKKESLFPHRPDTSSCMRRYWQAAMIALAESPRAKRWAQGFAATSDLARRYVGGADA